MSRLCNFSPTSHVLYKQIKTLGMWLEIGAIRFFVALSLSLFFSLSLCFSLPLSLLSSLSLSVSLSLSLSLSLCLSLYIYIYCVCVLFSSKKQQTVYPVGAFCLFCNLVLAELDHSSQVVTP
ncbi:hypothetical protein AALO_G00074260 [Alosa alosa]|uniref:Uncharacterized protein n=1 Tax=Alosa alosa TaxID=278164 RepID=A0AAV6H2Q5_9TELE|nr:hypothetical protein AALO_G00074260 [Alosa alosa]